MKTGKSLTELATEIDRRANAKRDFVAPLGRLEMMADASLAVRKSADDFEAFPVQNYAHEQLATYTEIPAAYYRRMLEEDPRLLQANVNRWLKAKKPEEQRLVRTLDGQVRAVLSGRYRTLENEDLAAAILPVLIEKDLMLVSCEVTARKLYIKAYDKGLAQDIPTGRSMGDGTHTFFDTVSPGVTISNSEIGAGTLAIQGSVLTHGCTNWAITEVSMRKYHAGARADVSEDVYEMLTDDTKRLTDKAVWSQVRDLVAGAFDRARFDAQLLKLKGAVEQKLPTKDLPEVIERVGKRFALLESERMNVLEQLIKAGDLTRYGVHAAITRAAADVEDYDRATELERLGGQVIELPQSEWRALAA